MKLTQIKCTICAGVASVFATVGSYFGLTNMKKNAMIEEAQQEFVDNFPAFKEGTTVDQAYESLNEIFATENVPVFVAKLATEARDGLEAAKQSVIDSGAFYTADDVVAGTVGVGAVGAALTLGIYCLQRRSYKKAVNALQEQEDREI